jgi:hypothetical protein
MKTPKLEFQRVNEPGEFVSNYDEVLVLITDYEEFQIGARGSYKQQVAWIISAPGSPRWLAVLPGSANFATRKLTHKPDRVKRFLRLGDARRWLKKEYRRKRIAEKERAAE